MQHPLTATRRQVVLDLLSALIGTRPSIVAEEHVGHEWAPVTRLTFDPEIPHVGKTVIVKTLRVRDGGWGGPAHLRREQIGLRIAEVAKVAPRLVAADDLAGVVVTTDLGRWPTLESVLISGNADAAATAMIGLGRTVGRLHAGTLRAEEQRREALAALGVAEGSSDRLGQWPGVERWHDVEVASTALGFPDASVAADDVAFVLHRLIEPAPFAALVHMDLNPTNALVTPDGVKLVDFEGAIFGHIGVDASSLRFPFPNYSAHWATLPPDVVLDVDRAYRAELARAWPSDALAGYDEMLAVGAAAALAVRVQRLTKLAEDDQPLDDRRRRRAQLVQQIRVFEQLAAAAGCLELLAGWYARLAHAMARRWEDATSPAPPLFPAFRVRAGM